MAWDKTQPANNSALLSPPIRANWDALDLAVMAPLAAGAAGVLFIRAGTALFTPASWTLNPHLIPASNNAYDLGSAAAQIRSLYAGTSLVLGTDAILSRDQANILAQRNGAGAPQTFHLYETYSDSANFSRLRLVADSTMVVQTQAAGTGVARSLRLEGAAGLILSIAGATSWFLDSDSSFNPGSTTYNIGSSVRPAQVYVDQGVNYKLGAAPPTPPAGSLVTYAKTDKRVYQKDETGAETPLGGSASPSMVPLWLENARFPDGSANNLFPLPVERISTGGPVGALPKLVELVYQFHFAPLSPEWLIWKLVAPPDYVTGGAVTLVTKWTMQSAITGNIRVTAAFGSVVDGTTVATALVTPAATTSADQSVPGTLGVQKETRLVLTSTGLTAGSKMVLACSLIAGSASPATGDRFLESAHLEFARA